MAEPAGWLYREHPAMFRGNPLLFLIGLIVPFIGWIGLGIWWIRARSERLSISNREVMLERGILARQRTQLNLSSIRTVRVSQGVLQRLFGIGDVEIFCAGDVAEISVRGLPDPNRARELAAAQYEESA